jgi:hypothetical protein
MPLRRPSRVPAKLWGMLLSPYCGRDNIVTGCVTGGDTGRLYRVEVELDKSPAGVTVLRKGCHVEAQDRNGLRYSHSPEAMAIVDELLAATKEPR